MIANIYLISIAYIASGSIGISRTDIDSNRPRQDRGISSTEDNAGDQRLWRGLLALVGLPMPQPSRRQAHLLLVHEMTTAVLLPALLGRLRAERLLLAVADGFDVVGSDAALHQSVPH